MVKVAVATLLFMTILALPVSSPKHCNVAALAVAGANSPKALAETIKADNSKVLVKVINLISVIPPI
jgi:hypothetical protein